MASIVNRPNGHRWIQFTGVDGKRQTLRLGKTPKRSAEAIKVHVERLVASQIVGGAVPDETSRWIADLLEKYVRPAIEMDGGHISLDSYQDGVVKLKLQGACSGCPSASLTLKSGIEGLLKRMIPEIKEVTAEEV